MAKSTKYGGDSYTETELADPNPPVRIRRAMLGGEQSLVGTDSSEPLSNESQSNAPETVNRQEPAQTTESLSGQTDKVDSIVNSTDGDGPETEMESSEIPPYTEWEYRELQAECKERGLTATGSTEELIARLEEFDDEQYAEATEEESDDFA